MKSRVPSSEPPVRASSHESKIKVFASVGWLCVILGFLAIIPGLCQLLSEPNSDTGHITLASLSSLGSYLQGAVQSLWSLAAFLFIYVAFLGQKQQLELQSDQFQIEQQRQEAQMKQQESELEDQRKQFRLQQQGLERQVFESSFFQLLNLHNQIATAMRGKDMFNQDERFGRACFEVWYKDSKKVTFSKKDGSHDVPPQISSVERYLWLYNQHPGELSHYFRNLYHLFRFVKESEALVDADPNIEYRNRRRYTSLVRATLSQFELALLFYNGVSDKGDKFKPLIEEFGLLENFDRNDLYDRKEDEKLYAPNAFE